ncbi:MAG: Wzz/FepE/Etk N-terminal domain-containing protein, partial [Acutalibacteraceae bacterium]|nr:Wzz/FepE/Etk N-terminal domain-containing protein [Acutalibacteraceae bacterium]
MNNISLVGMLKLALRYIYILIAVALIAAILAFSYCSFIAEPRYSSTGSIVVTNGAIINDTEVQTSATTSAKKVSSSDIAASLQLSNTIIDILGTNDIYKQLASDLGNKYT